MKKRLKLIIVVLVTMLVLLVVALVAVIWQHRSGPDARGLCLQKPGSSGLCDISLDVAATAEEQSQGLSGRESLPDDKGMFFAFTGSEVRCFWMKDMNFSIDMLWLDEKGTILAKEINVSPYTFPQNFCPDVNAHSVVELNANVAKDWPVGTTLSFGEFAAQ